MTDAVLRIGELSRRTGVSTDLLRQWERRYGLLAPRRSAGGFRLYGADDVARVLLMGRYLEQGLGAAEAAALVLSARERPADHPGLTPEEAVAALRRLVAALAAYDDGAADAVLARLLRTYAPVLVLRDVVLPLMRELGNGWDPFATQFFESRVRALARGWGRRGTPGVVVACPEGERHELGPLVFAVALRHFGCRVTFLGADTPAAAVGQAAERTGARAVVLGGVRTQPLRRAAAALGPGIVVLAGGAGAAGLADAAAALPADPIAAAEHVARVVHE